MATKTRRSGWGDCRWQCGEVRKRGRYPLERKRSNVVTGLQAGVFWFGRGMHPSQTRAIETPAFSRGRRSYRPEGRGFKPARCLDKGLRPFFRFGFWTELLGKNILPRMNRRKFLHLVAGGLTLPIAGDEIARSRNLPANVAVSGSYCRTNKGPGSLMDKDVH